MWRWKSHFKAEDVIGFKFDLVCAGFTRYKDNMLLSQGRLS